MDPPAFPILKNTTSFDLNCFDNSKEIGTINKNTFIIWYSLSDKDSKVKTFFSFTNTHVSTYVIKIYDGKVKMLIQQQQICNDKNLWERMK